MPLDQNELKTQIKMQDSPNSDRFNQEHLILALRSAALGAWETDLETGENTWDQGTADLLGIPADQIEVMSKCWTDYIHPEDRDAVNALFRAAGQQGTPYSPDFRVVRNDGAIRWFNSRGVVVPLPDGRRKMVGIVQDITERKAKEEALRESEERFRVAQELSPDGFTILRPLRDTLWHVVDFMWVYENAAIAKLNGTDPAAVVGRRLLDVIPSHADSPFHRAYQEVAESGNPMVLEAPFHGETMADEKWFRVAVVPMQGDIAILSQDITERKQAEEALRASEYEHSRQRAFLETLLDNADVCIAVMRGRGLRYTLVNRAYQALRPDMPMKGRTYGEVFPDAVAAGSEAIVQKVIETGEPHADYGYPIPIPGKPDAAWDHRIVRLPTDGEEASALIMTWDVTIRERALRALHESEARLVLAVKAGRSGTFDWDAKTNANLWSDDLLALYGMHRDEFGGRYEDWINCLLPEDREAGAAAVQQSLETGEFACEFRIRRFDTGEVRWMHGRGQVYFDNEDKPNRMAGINVDVTERKAAEEALRESEEKFRTVFEQAAIGIARVSFDDARYIEVNNTFCRMLGYTHDELISIFWPEITHPEDIDLDLIPFRRMAAGELDSYTVEKRFIHKQGHHVWARLTLSVVRDSNGLPFYEIAIIENINDKKLAEDSLRESEARFRTVLENMSEGLVLFDERDLIYQNTASLRIHGFAGPQDTRIEHKNLATTWKGWDETGRPLPFEEWPLARVLRHESFQDQVLRGINVETGREFWASYNGFPLLAIDDKLKLGFITIRDITESKRTQEHFQTLADNISQFAWITDTHGNVSWYNRRWYEYTGTDIEQMQGWGWTKVHHPDHVDRMVRKFSHCLRTGEIWEDTFPLRGKNGHYRWFLSRAIPIRDESGKILNWFGTNTDITVQRQTQEALHLLNENLEQQVADRTRVAEERSRQLRSLAIELIETEERERRQFAYLLHEDLQQMLAAAKMQVQAATDQFSSDPVLSNVANILEESIAKASRLSQNLSPAILHQAGLITALNWLARQVKEQFGLHVELDLNTELLMERTPQKVFLFRAVQELLFNIVKHAGVKSASIEVTSSEDSIAITISDQGRGFDPQILEKRTGNLGLGLFTIKERASYIGGAFTIESEIGQGSRFTLTVPNAAALDDEGTTDQAVAEEESQKPPRSKAISPGAGQTRVLFADDHKVMRQGLIKLVKDQAAIQVVGEASNGREAVELARKLTPDLIVMDISMPEMDGIEATRLIKAKLPQVRIIGLTMHDDPQLTASMRQAGAEIILNKTLSAAELVKAIYSIQ